MTEDIYYMWDYHRTVFLYVCKLITPTLVESVSKTNFLVLSKFKSIFLGIIASSSPSKKKLPPMRLKISSTSAGALAQLLTQDALTSFLKNSCAPEEKALITRRN